MTLRIALTGGIASGKSTVAQLFTSLGAKLLDTDHVAREIVVPGSPALQKILERFGGVRAPDGTLDRARLRQLVFTDAQARADLEAITHPAIRARVAQLSATMGGPYQLIAVPLLAETGTDGDYDRVLVVDCDPQLQLQRLMARERMGPAEAQRMIDAQVPRATRLAIADDVVHNEGDIGALATQVEALHQRYLALTASTGS